LFRPGISAIGQTERW